MNIERQIREIMAEETDNLVIDLELCVRNRIGSATDRILALGAPALDDDDDDDDDCGCYPGKWGGGEAESGIR
jgi:hypothetical protein